MRYATSSLACALLLVLVAAAGCGTRNWSIGGDTGSPDGADAADWISDTAPDVATDWGSHPDAEVPVDPEICGNGLDDNGNGEVDERCGCLPGSIQQCYQGDPATIDVGVCVQGTQGCEGVGEFGSWGDCIGAVIPTPDGCGDRLDQDCNGTPDDGPDCVCGPGETRACYTGPAATRGVGICRDGVQTCSDVPGVGWGDCLDQVLPREEICGNGKDDDCNGVVDDGSECECTTGDSRDCYSGPPEEIGVGVCRAGTQECVAGGRWGDCIGETGPTAEECGDGLDNDCNGSVDEGCPTTVTITIDLDGDCITTSCPSSTPYPVGCNIIMSGGDSRGCVASTPTSSVVYFQEGDKCGSGHVSGTLTCSNEPGTGLNDTNCPINKTTRYYPHDRSGCPEIDD